LLKVALDIHQILMLKNKIYNYFFNEILKNFITILITFTAIAWVVRAVNFLDLMVVDGYSSGLYFKYSLLNITSIMTRFVPLSFLLSLTISIIKFERQQELMILWTTGLAKIKVANIFLLVGLVVTVLQLILSLYINPLLLNTERAVKKSLFSII
jgi:lipopolysaccharide export system permease protein